MMTLKSTKMSRILFGLVVLTIVAGTAFPATYTVRNTDDSEEDSLRWAITQANSRPGPDSIEFNINGSGPHTIQLLSPLPELTEQVVIDGYTQPGSEAATDTEPAVLKIVLDGSSSSGHLGLLSIDPSASNCKIRGLVISNYDRNGIFIESGASGNVIEGNYIGTDSTGTAAQGNLECGIFIKSSNNRIGGTTPDARNVISCNGREGIIIHLSAASGNRVLGNYIGTDTSGTISLPNEGIGVAINNAPDNLVGGTAPGSRNVITDVSIGNPDATNNQVVGNYIGGINAAGTGLLLGLDMRDSAVHIGEASHNVIGPDNVISGARRTVLIWSGVSDTSVCDNYIGTDATGQTSIGNGWVGVKIESGHNSIEGNVISGFTGYGIYVQRINEIPSQNIIVDNIIGMNATKDAALPNGNGILIEMAVNTTVSQNLIARNHNTGVAVVDDLSIGNCITRNAIYDNDKLGIDLIFNGVTENDEGDGDTGPNKLMNFPVLTSAMATPGRLVVKGYVDTPNPTKVTLEFFANQAPDDSDYGEGEIYLGTAKPNANGDFTAALSPVPLGLWICATARDSDNNTSEFAFNIETEGPGKNK